MSFRNISAWSIRNPVPPIVLFVALTLAGIVSFARLDVNQNPDIDFPIAYVAISQPGAAPSELETQVTKRVEAAARNVQGVDELRSTVSEGSSETVLQLKIGQVSDAGVTILSGLDGTERVVLSAGGFLAPGQKVKPVTKKAS